MVCIALQHEANATNGLDAGSELLRLQITTAPNHGSESRLRITAPDTGNSGGTPFSALISNELLATCLIMASDIIPSVHIERDDWQAFVRTRPRPVAPSLIDTNQETQLDSQMLTFINDVSKTTLSVTCSSAERKWLHRTAEYLNMESHSPPGPSNVVKTITIRKLAGCGLPNSMADAIQRVKNSSHNVAKKQAKQQAKQARQARMDSWSTSCQECNAPLGAYNAFYHHGGMGPWCEECIEANEETEGLKWEPKCSFWY